MAQKISQLTPLVNDLGPQDKIEVSQKDLQGVYRTFAIDYGTLLTQLQRDIALPPQGLSPPSNATPPVINGTPQVGVTLTVSPGSWNGNPAPVLTYQWLANDLAIGGATGTTYVPVSNDVGKIITVRETATNNVAPFTASVISVGVGPVVSSIVADVTVHVFASNVDGALVRMTSPGTSFTGAHAGLSIKTTGEIYISDRTAFLASLPAVVPTSGQSYGFILDPADYFYFLGYTANMAAWFDVSDHRNIKIDEITNTVLTFTCKIDPVRIARQDLYGQAKSPTYVLDSSIGVGIPGVSFDPPDTTIYGLFFPDSPLSAGIQRIAFSSTTKMQSRWDNEYDPNILSQGNISWPSMDMAANLTVAKPVIMTCIANKQGGLITFRVNGLQTDTAPQPETFAGSGVSKVLDYNSICFLVFYADNAGFSNVSQIFCGSALGNAFTWKQAGFRGDFFELISLVEASPAA